MDRTERIDRTDSSGVLPVTCSRDVPRERREKSGSVFDGVPQDLPSREVLRAAVRRLGPCGKVRCIFLCESSAAWRLSGAGLQISGSPAGASACAPSALALKTNKRDFSSAWAWATCCTTCSRFRAAFVRQPLPLPGGVAGGPTFSLLKARCRRGLPACAFPPALAARFCDGSRSSACLRGVVRSKYSVVSVSVMVTHSNRGRQLRAHA